MTRPFLRRVPIEFAFPLRLGCCYCTMLVGQWDHMLSAAYELGWFLLELDPELEADRQIIAVYQRNLHEN